MKLQKKILAVLLSLLMMLCAFVPASADDNYWTLAEKYENAKMSGDDGRIVAAALAIESYYRGEVSETAYARVYAPLSEAAKAYERLQKFDLCGAVYQRLVSYVQWLSTYAASATDRYVYFDALQAMSRKARYFVSPELYALTDNTEAIPYYNARNEPIAGTYTGMCDTFQSDSQSAFLLYVQYETQEMGPFFGQIPLTTDTMYLELAWNVKNENLADLIRVNSGATDAYMTRQLQALEQYATEHPNCKILLRFGAEVNCWQALNAYGQDREKLLQFAATFRAAFRRVADEAHRVAPHVAMVFSLVDYGHWYTRPSDFYPGDEYVDWIGMSTYYNPVCAVSSGVGHDGDMLMGMGLYNSPVTRVGEITALAKAHQKPVMISECGFRFSDPNGSELPVTAEKMREFYTYLNMVHPQIKLINYFNTNYGDSRYRLYPFSGYTNDNTTAPLLKSTYEATIAANGAIASTMPGEQTLKSYTTLGGVRTKEGKLTVCTYADYPTTAKTTVSYQLNGKTIHTTEQLPYAVTLNAADMNAGANCLTATIRCGNTTVTQKRLLYLSEDGCIDGQMAGKRDLVPDGWYVNAVGYCMYHNLMQGTGDDTFSPGVPVSRAMLVQVLYRLYGSPAVSGTSSFTDLGAGAWYEKAVRWAEQNGVVNGVGGNRFQPNGVITRETVVTMLARYQRLVGDDAGTMDAIDPSCLNQFSDKAAVSAWALDAVCWSVQNGIIGGKGNGRMDPQGGAVRAELAQILWKYQMLTASDQ